MRYLWIFLSVLFLASCSSEPPTEPAGALPGAADRPGVVDKTANQTLINNYIVQYDGRTFTGGETTFRYTVYGTGVDPALSHFTLELPDCAPELSGYSPTNSVSINENPQTGIYGIEWHLNVEADDSVGRQYSISFPGDVPEGVIFSAVKSGNTNGVGQVYGPCAGFVISGSVFIDADVDGERDFDESGIADVVVELTHDDGTVDILRTDAFGGYSIIRAAGTYTLQIPAAYPDAFNAELSESFDATTPLTREIVVADDSAGNDFGFAPQTEEIIFELEGGVLPTDGESVKFWIKELRAALRNGGGNAVYDRATMEGFLADIQELFLDEVFAFTPGNELQEAYDILRSNSREPIDELLRQLLATEFNEVSGRGLIGENAELQDVLIAWGEAVWVENQEAARVPGTGSEFDYQDVILAQDVAIPPAIEIFTLINTGGGGGADE
jgi:hypothetical protein